MSSKFQYGDFVVFKINEVTDWTDDDMPAKWIPEGTVGIVLYDDYDMDDTCLVSTSQKPNGWLMLDIELDAWTMLQLSK